MPLAKFLISTFQDRWSAEITAGEHGMATSSGGML
jgi:hypothetical protein